MIRRSRRRTTIALRVTRTDVVLHAPHGVPEPDLLNWVERKRGWIEKAQAHFAQRTPHHHTLEDGSTLPLLGQTLTIRRGPHESVTRHGEELHVPDLPHPQLLGHVEHWYREQALAYFTPLSHELAARLGRAPRDVKLTEARTRWGSCTASGVLRYNWRVLLGPPDVARYLCAHEVAHLRELNHSARFWTHVATLCPTYAQDRRRLREEGWKYNLNAEPTR